jgi:hypothetical protein
VSEAERRPRRVRAVEEPTGEYVPPSTMYDTGADLLVGADHEVSSTA